MAKDARAMVRNAFNGQRRLRAWRNTHFGGMQAVKAHPLAICRFRPDEGGTVTTNLNVKLAPVSGYMRSKAYVDVIQIFVPYQAIEKLELDQQEDAGVTEMARRRLLAGQGIGLEDESQVTRAANIHPISIGGQKRVTRTARLAYNCAVNHLRKHAYYSATQLNRTHVGIQPAVLTANVLERFNGVLEPERLIDGAINLTGEIPVKGVARVGSNGVTHHNVAGAVEPVRPNDGTAQLGGVDAKSTTYPHAAKLWDGNQTIHVRMSENGVPQIFADLAGASEITLRDMIKSQKLDQLVREFAQMIQDDPINGEELVARALYGLSVDYDHNPQVMYRQVHELTAMHQRPTDGASINDVSAHFELNARFATVIPRSELGGQLVTICMVKPVETLAKQPDPAQTEVWEVVNRVHDETELEEVLLKRSHLESSVTAANEDQDVFWVGHNALKHDYATQGANAQQVAQVEMKSSMWTYEIPTSVTPENVNYPENGINMYPFFNWNGAHAEYTISQVAAISTSLAKGPNPVERIQLFADDPALIEE